MKKILVAIVVVAVILGAIPYGSGIFLEKTVRRTVGEFNAVYAETVPGYSLEVVSYKRGYLTSDFEWKIIVPFLAKFSGVESIILKEHARHGFGGIVSTTSLEGNPWFDAFVKEKLQGKSPLHIQTAYHLFSGIESITALDAFSVATKDGDLRVKPAKMVVSADRGAKHVKTSGNFQGISLGEKFSMDQISMASELDRITSFIWDGTAEFNVGHVRGVETGAGFDMADVNLKYLLKASQEENLMGGEMHFSFASLQAEGKKIEDASVRLGMQGIKLDGYEAFMKQYTQTMSKVLEKIPAAGASAQDEEALKWEMAQIGLRMTAAFEKLLATCLEFRVSELKFTLPEGEVKGDLTLRLLKDMTFLQFAPLIYQPRMLMDVFHIESEVSMPQAMAGENQDLLSPVYPGMQTGLFVKDGDRLVLKAETKDGKLILNGQEVLLGGAPGAQ